MTARRWMALGIIATWGLTTAGGALAQSARSAAERATDRGELARDRAERRDDRADLARIEELIQRLDRNRGNPDRAALTAIDSDIKRLVAAELAEGRRELSRDRAEAARSREEMRSERREVRQDVAEGRPGRAIDDRRDLRDDRRDAVAEAATLERRREIATALRALDGRFDRQALARKRALLVELGEIAKREIHGNRVETREDRRELREDRR